MLHRMLAATLLAAALPTLAMAQSDQDKIQGLWAPADVVNNGIHLAGERVKCMLVKIDDKRMRIKEASRNFGEVIWYQLDPSKSPKEIDLSCPHDFSLEPPLLGIYRFDGDDGLTICWRRSGGPRPKEFATCPLSPLYAKNLPERKPWEWAYYTCPIVPLDALPEQWRAARANLRPPLAMECPLDDSDLIMFVLRRVKNP